MTATFALDDLRDIGAAVERVRRLLDADCDPVAVGRRVRRRPADRPARAGSGPGLRVPGHVDGHELAVRAVLGQQVSVAGARTVAGRTHRAHGRPLAEPAGDLTHLFPDAATLAALDPDDLPMPRSRGRALVALCAALADGTIALDRGADRDDVRRRLLALPGIGPWTADYIALRALGHPDVFLPTDIGIRDALAGLGQDPAAPPTLADALAPVALLRPAAPLANTSTVVDLPRPRRTDMWTVMDSPIGELRIVEQDGAITAIEFSPFRDASTGGRVGERGDDNPVLARAVEQLTAYFARDLKEFDLPLAPHGTDFQQQVWEQLLEVGYGETASYGEIAHRLGHDQRRLARGRAGQRPQPDPDRDPVPPGHRRQRHPHRLRRRARAQADPARAGAGGTVLSDSPP